jgi:hypothetical protein
MDTPEAYIDRISQIVGDDIRAGDVKLKIAWTNRDEAQAALAGVRRMQTDLRRLNREIASTTKGVRSTFTTKKTDIGVGFGAAFAAGLFGRRRMGKVNAVKRDSLRQDQLAITNAYDAVRRVVDSIIAQLDQVKAKIEDSPEFRSRPAARQPKSVAGDEAMFLVKVGEEVKGPLTVEQVRGLLIAGVITTASHVQPVGVDAWVPVSAVKVLQHV